MSNPIQNYARGGGNSLETYHNQSGNKYWSQSRQHAGNLQLREHGRLHNQGYSNSNFSDANKAAYRSGAISRTQYVYNQNVNKLGNQAKHDWK